MGRFFEFKVHKTVVTSSLALARALWVYGEPELAGRALSLSPDAVLDVGVRVATLMESGEAAKAWPDGPRERPVLLAVVEHLEGAYRPCRLDVSLPKADLPAELQATEKQLSKAADPVNRAMEARAKAGHPVP
jgi:hypothetical protein